MGFLLEIQSTEGEGKWVEDRISAFQVRGQHGVQIPLELAAERRVSSRKHTGLTVGGDGLPSLGDCPEPLISYALGMCLASVWVEADRGSSPAPSASGPGRSQLWAEHVEREPAGLASRG